MIEPIDDMPAGTVGLRGGGRFTVDDYRNVLEPALDKALATGEMRLLFVLEGFDGLEPGAWIEDAKTGLAAIVKHHSAWKRMAFMTDVEWIRKSTRALAWLVPGELRVGDLDGVEEARSWVAG